MSARLRLASLEDLEGQSQPRQSLHRQQNLEKSPAPESRLPREHSHVSQILYQKDVYKDYPAWKRWMVEYVYLPIFRQFHRRLNLFPPTRMEPDGTYSWLVHQGCFFTEEEAKADAARYAHGYVVPNVPLGRSLTADIAEDSSIYFAKSKEEMNKEGLLCAPLMEAQEELRKLKAEVRLFRSI